MPQVLRLYRDWVPQIEFCQSWSWSARITWPLLAKWSCSQWMRTDCLPYPKKNELKAHSIHMPQRRSWKMHNPVQAKEPSTCGWLKAQNINSIGGVLSIDGGVSGPSRWPASHSFIRRHSSWFNGCDLKQWWKSGLDGLCTARSCISLWNQQPWSAN